MKKSVIITIFVIYIFGILVVGFLGAKTKVYEQEVYATDIECKTEGFKLYDPSKPEDQAKIAEGFLGYIDVKYQEGLEVELKIQIVPANATYKKVNFYNPQDGDKYEIIRKSDTSAIVKFKKAKNANILVSSEDEKVQKYILIRVLRNL